MKWVLSFLWKKKGDRFDVGIFCNSPRLQLLERQMRQPPGYRPRGQGWMFDMEEWKSRGNYSEIVDCVISRMQMEHLKKGYRRYLETQKRN